MSQASSPEASATSLPRGGKPVREIENPKPKLWIYDHCPFCVRARYVDDALYMIWRVSEVKQT